MSQTKADLERKVEILELELKIARLEAEVASLRASAPTITFPPIQPYPYVPQTPVYPWDGTTEVTWGNYLAGSFAPSLG